MAASPMLRFLLTHASLFSWLSLDRMEAILPVAMPASAVATNVTFGKTFE